MFLSKFFHLYCNDKISWREVILQLFYYSAVQNLICLHIINLNSKASSFSNSSCHFYRKLNTARNLNIMTSMATCDTKHVPNDLWHVHSAVLSNNHSYRLVQFKLLTSEKHISRYIRFSPLIRCHWIRGPLLSILVVSNCPCFYVDIFNFATLRFQA
jgi:hypothetical protein